MRKSGLIIGLALLLVSCAVVNVYVTFPQEKIDQAMEGLQLDIQKDVPSVPPAAPASKKQGRLSPRYFWEPAALYAATVSPEMKTSSPVIDQAQARRKERVSDIQNYKKDKVVGENRDGLLEIRSSAGMDGEQSAALQKMVKADNSDRMIIYREIVQINSMPSSQLKNVQTAAAKANRKNAAEPLPAYETIDKDSKGSVSKEQFVAALKEKLGGEDAAKAKFDALDKNSDGKLTKEEYAAAAEQKKRKKKNQ